MTEESITEVETPSGNVHTTRTVIESDRGSGGGSGWLIAIVLILAVLVGGYFLMQGSKASTHKDNAIAGAANDVGDAAQKVGNAAENAVKKLDDGK